MKLIFFDEAKDDNDYKHYHIGGVCIDEDHMFEIEDRINQIAQQSFGRSDLVRETEFHAAEIYHRKKHFKSWNDFNQRIDLLYQFMELLSLKEVQLIDIQINCEKLVYSQVPEEIAFMFFCERANRLVRLQKSVGILIGDRESDRISEKYALSLSDYKARGTNFAFGQDIKNLVDSVHFTHSHLSRFLQLADIYTWLSQFINRNRGSDNFRHKAIFECMQKQDINIFPDTYKEWPK